METAKPELVNGFFERLAEREIEAAFELATEDVIFDWRSSTAPWGSGVAADREQAAAAYRSFLAAWDEVGGVRWEPVRDRSAGGGRRAVETRISGRGPTTGLAMDARGGWVISARDDRISEAILHQSFEEALLAGRRRAIEEARLYFVCEARPAGSDPRPLLDAALRGGVEMIQLRDKEELVDEDLVAAAEPFREAANAHGALFILNDRADLVADCDADGVHVGQDDLGVAEARRAAGPAAVVGLSTHATEQFDAAIAATGADRPDQLSAGPVWATPTKEGRPAAGPGLIRHAADTAPDAPWFAIGGIDASNIDQVLAAGARRVVVVRAIRDAADPEAAARALAAALEDRRD